MSSQGDRRPVLVTGANGLVGSRIVARLAEHHRVIAVARGPAREAIGGLVARSERADEAQGQAELLPVGARPEVAAGAGVHAGVEYVDLDLRLADELRDLVETTQPAAVFHAAAATDVDGCERDPVFAWQLNVRAVEAVALGCREAGARLVALSTDYVFDGEAGPYSEEDRPNPRGVYARTKRVGEEAALLLAPDAQVCRVAVIYSGRRGAKRTFAVGVAESLLAGKEVKAFHDQVVSPTLADDAAALCIGVWERGGPGLWHCSGSEAVTRVDFCQRLARKLGADERLIVPVATADVKLPAPRPLKCGLKTDKVRALLGPGFSLGVDAALDRFLAERSAP
ncbi:MAG: SDR family oxidoreductase [Deltaproteobacteria bacterium]|nr:SDR family oxidoreductase [Deltaproteobacteria bacterium]